MTNYPDGFQREREGGGTEGQRPKEVKNFLNIW